MKVSDIDGYEVLVRSDHCIEQIIVQEAYPSTISIAFTIYDVETWDGNTGAPLDCELYMSGIINWEGRLDLKLGENGEIRIEGRYFLEAHFTALKALFEFAEKKLKVTMD